MKNIPENFPGRNLASLFVRTAAAIVTLLSSSAAYAVKNPPAGQTAFAAPMSVPEIAEKAKPAVAKVESHWHLNGTDYPGTGSAFTINQNGFLITNAHVVSIKEGQEFDGGPPAGTLADDIVIDFSNGRSLKARISAIDIGRDLALLRVDAKDLPYLSISTSPVHAGDTAIAYGSPRGFPDMVSVGIISNPYALIQNHPYRQTDALITPGSSGGPLFSVYGDVIGVNTIEITWNGLGKFNDDINRFGFDIPASAVIDFVNENGPDILMPQSTHPSMEKLPAVLDRAKRSVVGITKGWRSGAGLVVRKDGLILTMSDMAKLDALDNPGKPLKIDVALDGTKQSFPASVVSVNFQAGLALIKINPPKPLQVLESISSEKMHLADSVIAASFFNSTLNLTKGIISQQNPVIHIDAPVVAFGGPVINTDGKLVGFHTGPVTKIAQIISADLLPSAVNAILNQQPLPAHWESSIVKTDDANQQHVTVLQATACVSEEQDSLLVDRINPSIVSMPETMPTVSGDQFVMQQISGVIVSSDGLIVTSKRDSYSYINAKAPIDVRLSNGKTMPATLVGTNNALDISVYQINGAKGFEHIDLTPPPFDVKAGERALMLGAIGSYGGPFATRFAIANPLRQEPVGPKAVRNFIEFMTITDENIRSALLIDSCGRPLGLNVPKIFGPIYMYRNSTAPSKQDLDNARFSPNHGVSFAMPWQDVRSAVAEILKKAGIPFPTTQSRPANPSAVPR